MIHAVEFAGIVHLRKALPPCIQLMLVTSSPSFTQALPPEKSPGTVDNETIRYAVAPVVLVVVTLPVRPAAVVLTLYAYTAVAFIVSVVCGITGQACSEQVTPLGQSVGVAAAL